MRRNLLSCAVAALVFAVSPGAYAASFIVPTDRELVDLAKAIVIATAVSSYPVHTSDGFIDTVNEFRVDEVIKGDVDVNVPLQLIEGGGALDGHFDMVPDAPKYEVGERALIFVGTNKRGENATWGMILGKFSFVRDLHGRKLLIRGADEGEIFGWDACENRHEEPIRSEQEFLRFVRGAACGNSVSENYVLPKNEIVWRLTPKSDVNSQGFHADDYQDLVVPAGGGLRSGGIRWQCIFDQPASPFPCLPNGSVTFQTVGTEAGVSNALGGVDRAMAAWNGNSLSNINYVRGAATGAPFADDSINSVHLDDSADVPGSAIGFSRYYGGDTYAFDGANMAATTNADVAVKPMSSQQLYEEVLTHELGHTLSFRHSGDRTPATSAAVMNAVSSGSFGANLQQWDHDAASTVYNPNPAGICTNPSITMQPQSQTIAFGAQASLSVTAGGSAPLSYQWYVGTSPDTSSPAPGATSAFFNPSPTSTTNYWVRVSNSCTPPAPANSQTATVTVQPCQPPAITAQPLDQSVTSGNSAFLSVSFVGSNPVTVTWYRGTSPDISNPIGTGPSINTTPLTSTTNFWARLQNSCPGQVDTRTVTITVAPCQPPVINDDPQDQTVAPGASANLFVGYMGTAGTVTWFRGTFPDSSSQAGSGQFFMTPALSSTTSFWAQITNSCGSTNSRTVTITVSFGCTSPTITTNPANQTVVNGTSVTLAVVASGTGPLHYAWFQGAFGDQSKPVGTDSSSFKSAALTTPTQFWVMVTNSCGLANSAAASVSLKPGRPRAVKHR